MSDTTNPKDALGLRKPPLRLIPAPALLYLSRVMGLGAVKYGPYNWRGKPVRFTVYLEAAMRHILSALDGENIDPESHMPPEAHAMACMAIILDARATGNLIDDRPPPGAAEKLIAELTQPNETPLRDAPLPPLVTAAEIEGKLKGCWPELIATDAPAGKCGPRHGTCQSGDVWCRWHPNATEPVRDAPLPPRQVKATDLVSECERVGTHVCGPRHVTATEVAETATALARDAQQREDKLKGCWPELIATDAPLPPRQVKATDLVPECAPPLQACDIKAVRDANRPPFGVYFSPCGEDDCPVCGTLARHQRGDCLGCGDDEAH